MRHILQNENIALHIDSPDENYQQSRFDWTGKITQATYKGIVLLGSELSEGCDAAQGRGLYNEFGFKLPLGFDEIAPGEWFHKIGVGLLQKDSERYDFLKPLEIKPAHFDVEKEASKIKLVCHSDVSNGYAYELKKCIRLTENGWTIDYSLQNTGSKTIITNEYTHNFISIDGAPTDSSSQLTFPFDIKPSSFDESINPEGLVSIGLRDIKFLSQPAEPFFFSYMSGIESVKSKWTLRNAKRELSISESADFKTKNVCLWGSGHVISPELYIDIHLPAGNTTSWTRTYRVFES